MLKDPGEGKAAGQDPDTLLMSQALPADVHAAKGGTDPAPFNYKSGASTAKGYLFADIEPSPNPEKGTKQPRARLLSV